MNEPKLRFPGFTEPWEQRKFSDVVVTRRGLTYRPCDVASEESGIRVLRSSNINEDQYIQSKNDVFVKREAVNIQFAKEGDILITSANGSNRLVGKHAIITGVCNDVVPGGFMLLASTKNHYFINASMSSAWYSRFINLYVSGGNGAIGNLSKSDLDNQSILLPSEEEQQKIGAFFKNLDDLITLHQRKLDDTKLLKQSMLQKMFPKSGEDKPEIRFPGFTEPWEQRKLLDVILKITDFRGRTPKKLGMDWSNDGYLALSALNVKDGYIDFSQDIHYGSQQLYDKWMTGNELHKGQVLFTTEAPMGNVAQVPDNRQYILSQRTIALDVKPEIMTEDYLAVLLRSPDTFAKLTSLSSGGTAKGVSQKSLAEVQVMFPTNLSEQDHIAQLFIYLDDLITLHQRKLDGLKELKQALLQQMFI